MPPFRFNIPFFSYGSPSRLSSGTSSPSPPPTPPSRPPFRPAGIAQPSKPSTLQETKSKVSPLLSKVKSNVEAIGDSSSATQLPSHGADTPTRLAKQSNQSGSQLKKGESLGAEEKNVAMKEKSSRENEKEGGKKVSTVIEKPTISRSERKVAEEAQEQRTNTEAKKLAVEEKNKILSKDMEQNSKTAQEQQKRKETEKLAVEAKKKILSKDMEENSKIAQEQQKRKETEKLALQERNKALQSVGGEDAPISKITRLIAAASESTRGPKNLPERKTQNRTEIHTDDNHQKYKGISTGNHELPRDGNRDGLSSMSRKIKEDIRDGVSKLTCGKSNSDDKSVSVFTLTGENRGATMAIGSEKGSEIHIRRGYRSNPDESPNTTATETDEERRRFKGKNPKEYDEEEAARVRSYLNGNTQAINNSIVLESSVSENDPGVHMSLKFEESKKETVNRPVNVAEKKSETVKTTGKLRNEPRVRRRCLRGLLAESSESENPLKPRRHGCKFTCKDKDIENT